MKQYCTTFFILSYPLSSDWFRRFNYRVLLRLTSVRNRGCFGGYQFGILHCRTLHEECDNNNASCFIFCGWRRYFSNLQYWWKIEECHLQALFGTFSRVISKYSYWRVIVAVILRLSPNKGMGDFCTVPFLMDWCPELGRHASVAEIFRYSLYFSVAPAFRGRHSSAEQCSQRERPGSARNCA